MPTVDFIFDVASPNAYLVHRLIPAIEARTGASFNYVPCLLGGIFKATGNQAPMMAFGEIKGKLAYEQLETRRFIEKHRLTEFTLNPHFPINTLTIMRCMAATEMEGRDTLQQFIAQMLHYMWEEPRNLNDPEVLRSTLADAGYNAGRMLALAQTPEVKSRLISNTEHAVARGAFGIPTIFVDDEIYFGKERMGQVEEAISR
jgi:2-hydroxychromene-2-carboxylate isomerase